MVALYPNTKIFEGREYFVADFKALVPVEADTEAGILIMWAPAGGLGLANFQAFAKGDNGKPALISEDIDFAPLSPTDPTPESASFTTIQPGTDVLSQIVKLRLRLRNGQDGAPGTSVLDPNAYGTKIAGRILELRSDLTGFQYAAQKSTRTLWPTAGPIVEAAAVSATTYDLWTCSVAANEIPFDWRPDVAALSMVTNSAADMRVDLVARLNGSLIVGKCPGIAGLNDRLILAGAPDAGTSAAAFKVAANAAATVVVGLERVGGTGTFSSGIADLSRVSVKAVPA